MAYPDTLDYTEDYLVWNERETVQYKSKTTEAIPSDSFELTDTLWTTLERDAIKADSQLSVFDVRVQIAGVKFPSNKVPKEGDLMVRSNGTQWIVRKIEGPDPVDYDVYCNQDFAYQQGLER